jgi:NHLM bacteriocin system ABC transporter ATP-binding protein
MAPPVDPTTPLASLLDHGQVHEVAGNTPFLLDQPENFWLVIEGQVEIFAVAPALEEAGRSRIHLGTATAGQALFGLGERRPQHRALPFGPAAGATQPGAGLLAVAVPHTKVLVLRIETLQGIVRTAANPQCFVPLVDTWLRCLFSTLRPGAPPRVFQALERGKEFVFAEDGAMARSAEGVIWARQVAGRSFFLGRDDLPVATEGFLLPLTDDTWLRAAKGLRLSVVDTAVLLRAGTLWDALERYHHLLLRYVGAVVQNAAHEERARLQRQAARDDDALQQAYRRLASVLGAEAPAAEGEKVDDALLAACQRVGAAAGIRFRRPRSGAATLQRICWVSRIRHRRVLLRDEWWRLDHGPLLAYRAVPGKGPASKARGAPVALLPAGVHGYFLVEADGSRRAVDAKLAGELTGEARMFYRPLPERAADLLDLGRLAFAGRGRDGWRIAAAGLAGGLLTLAVPLFIGHLVAQVIPAADRGQLLLVALALALAALAGAACQVARSLAALRLAGNADVTLQAALWDRLLALPASFFRRYTVGDLADRVLGIDAIRDLLTGDVIHAALAAVFSGLSLALLFYFSPPLALMALALITVLVLAGAFAALLQVRRQTRWLDARGRLSALLFGLIHGIAKLRIAGAERRAFALWAERFAQVRVHAVGSQRVAGLLTTFTLAYPLLCTLSLFAMVTLSTRLELPLADFLAFNAAFGQLQGAALALIASLSKIVSIFPIYRRLRPILAAAPEVAEGQVDPGELRGDFELSHVSFRYQPDGPAILDDVSFTARAGELVALVGPSGAGKSTCLRLILGFEQPTSGSIYFDGQDLPSLDVAAVRRQVGVVLQGGRPLAGDLFTNIVGDDSALTLEDAWTAARLAGIEADIHALPMGMFTVLGEGGGTFSGGQRQRLLIARAVVHRPRLLVFDEATSALDNRSQAAIRESLAQLKATRIVVAHRLSTIVHADRIVVLEAGKVVETGTYAELIAKGGLFHRLAVRQQLDPGTPAAS